MKTKRTVLAFISFILVLTMAVNFAGCTEEQPTQKSEAVIKTGKSSATELTAGLTANKVSGKKADDEFTKSQFEFYAKLFKACVNENENENVFVSPLSVQLALAMTANGADGETKAEMEKLLGDEIPLDELNEYLYYYVNSLPSNEEYKAEIENSIWIRDDKDRLQAENDFLQKCNDYYWSQVFKAPFDSQTVEDINSWVSDNTDGMIEKIIDKIEPEEIMLLLNTVMFDAQWETPYEEFSVNDGTFTSVSGKQRNVKMMASGEELYLTDDKATGFIKNYKDGKYAFAALLPNENININKYIESLTGEKISEILKNAQSERVYAKMPKFSCEFGMSLKNVLSGLGMKLAFDTSKADFSKMAKLSDGNIFIGDVFHKTFISVNERGTKAGAVTRVDVNASSAPVEIKEVFLDRPFVYMIIDKSQNLPIFMGVLTDINE